VKKYYLIFLLAVPQNSLAQIYQCKNTAGKTLYRDSPCNSAEQTVNVRPLLPAPIQKDKKENARYQNPVLSRDMPSKLIYSDKRPLKKPYTIKVNEVRIVSETDDSLEVDVIYTYQHKVPADQIRLYITPNHNYWRVAPQKIERGQGVVRASIGLAESNMKKDRRRRSTTDKIFIRFDHYLPQKFVGNIWSKTVKYKKQWRLR